MPNVLNLINDAVSQGEAQSWLGAVAPPPPVTHRMPLNIALSWAPDHNVTIAPGSWAPIHGSVMPKLGDVAVVFTDDTRHVRCIWWGPSGTAGHRESMTRVYVASASASTGAGWNPVPFNSIDMDSGENAVFGQFGRFKYLAPHGGVYRVSGQVEITVPSGLEAYVSVFKNEVEVSRGERKVYGASAAAGGLVVSDVVGCVQGDVLDLRVWTSVPVSYMNLSNLLGDGAVGPSNHFSAELTSTW